MITKAQEKTFGAGGYLHCFNCSDDFLWVHMNIIKEIHIVSRKTQTNMSMRTIHAHLCDEVEKLIISVADENVKRCSPILQGNCHRRCSEASI